MQLPPVVRSVQFDAATKPGSVGTPWLHSKAVQLGSQVMLYPLVWQVYTDGEPVMLYPVAQPT